METESLHFYPESERKRKFVIKKNSFNPEFYFRANIERLTKEI